MSTESRITEALEAMQSEGVPMAVIGEIEARMLTMLYKARRVRNAAAMLPLLGAEVTAERLGCCPRTVYNLVHNSREKHLQEMSQACA